MDLSLFEGLDEILNKYANKSEKEIKEKLSFTQHLKDSINVYVKENNILLEFSNYGKWVDRGRKPGKMPPYKKLEGWVKEHGMPSSAAFPIARNIGKRGIPARPWLYVFDDNLDEMLKEIADQIAENVKHKFDDVGKKK